MAHREELDQQLQEESKLALKTIERAREAYLLEQEKTEPDPQVKFDYAYVLTKSPNREDKYRGIGLLEDLIDQGFNTSDCMYFIALAYYALGEFGKSRNFVERLLRRDPTNIKAVTLHDCIKEVVAKDGAVGLGIVAVGTAVAALAVHLLVKKSRG